MFTRRSLLATGAVVAGAGCLGEGVEDEQSDGGQGETGPEAEDRGVSLSSPAFTAGEPIPERYTCDGEDVSPPLEVSETPEAESAALIVEDPDAPTEEPFVHWLLWNLPPDIEAIPEGIPREQTVEQLDGAVQGTNDFGAVGYRGPCPPVGDGPHSYEFTLQFLETSLDLEPGAGAESVRSALDSGVHETVTMTGSYERS